MDNFTISDQYGEYSTLRAEDGKPVVLGRGGFGVTICAFKLRRLGEVEIRDEFALKILRYNAMDDSTRRSRILKEILALRDLQHPNLASYKDCGEDEGCVFLVMELCRGGDLAALASRVGALPERFALQVVLQVCAGLDEAHRKGYFHRDLKPTNILISEELPPDVGLPWLEDRLASGHLRFKVVDFGLAGRFESEGRGGGFMGSPMFASPEQVREQRLDSRSDIYSMGMTLWYLATGKGPLLNANGLPVADAREAMRCHTSPLQHDLEFPAHFSEGFRSLLGRMVRKAPDERFRSAQELAEAIRRQIEAMPAPPVGIGTQPAGMPSSKSPATSVATWGTGTFAEYYHVLRQVGRRSIGTFYQARQKASGKTVGFTAWVAANSPNAPSEKVIGQHLERLKSVTNDPLAPKVLVRIVDWLRTADEWCVAEEWSEGEKLDRFVSSRGRSIALQEAARLLWPVAEACDYLYRQEVYSALLSVDEIRLLSPRTEPEGPNWIEQPIDEWGDWTIRLSAMSIPQELAGESTAPGAVESSTTSRFDGCDAGQLRLNKSFCRLLYRLIEGADAAVAADWDSQAFTAAGKLGAESNALLRDYISGVFADDLAVDILKRICSSEGITRVPGRADSIAAPNVPPTRAIPVGTASTRSSEPANLLPVPPGSSTTRVAPSSMVQPSGSAGPTARSSVGGSRHPRKPEPILDAAPASQIEIAQLVPGRPGFVRSPYGPRREQQVPGLEWRENAHVKCQATSRPFQLPAELPPFEAILIGGRFDSVLTPYVEPPQEVAVPLGKWKAGAELTCSATGQPLTMPQELSVATATTIDDRPGVVRSPYGDCPEVEVMAESWKPGQLLVCPASGQSFALPNTLPPLIAISGDTLGTFTSPYALDRSFNLPAPKCVPGLQFACPWTSQQLVLPASLPGHWHFEGIVRQSETPEVRSPFVESESESWQPVDAVDWHPGAIIQCRGTGREFLLPASLPVLSVKAGPNPFSILSPFPHHEPICIPAADWIAGTEISLSLNTGKDCRVALPVELSVPDRVKTEELEFVPQGVQPQARGSLGIVRSPFVDEGEWIEVSGQNWLPGERFTCSATSRPFWLPRELPVLEARLGTEPGTVLSPYTDRVLKIPAVEWIGGNSFQCPDIGTRFLLPDNLPWLEGGVDASRPGWVESPFDLGSAYLIDYSEWKPGEVLECPTSGRKFALPASLPEWVPDAELDPTNPGMVRDPNGPGKWFKVSGAEWESGTTIHCPETKTKLTLPADLPPLEATLVEGRPGFVQSPYTSESGQVKVHSSKWSSGGLVECPITKRPLRLPDNLPPLPSAPPRGRKLLLPAVAIILLALVGTLVASQIHKSGLEKLRVRFRQEARTEFTWVIPPSESPIAEILHTGDPHPPPPPPPPDALWPKSIILVQGIEPPDAAIYLAAGDGERMKLEPDASTSGIKRTIQLSASNDKALQNWLMKNDKAQELRLECEAPGFQTSRVPVTRGDASRSLEISSGTELNRELGNVRWEGKAPFFSAVYDGLKFELNNPLWGDKYIKDQPVVGGAISLPTGEYTVTLIGKRGFSESRIVENKLSITKEKPADVRFPPPIPQHLGGIGLYAVELPFVALNRTKASYVGKTTTEVFKYWTPCLLDFEKDFTKGNLTEENSLLGPNLMLTLDLVVFKLATDDSEKSRGKALDEYAGYKDNKDLLNGAFREASAFGSPSDVVKQNASTLFQKRRTVFENASGIWKSVKQRGLENKFYEGPINQPQNDITLMNRWVVKLQSVLMGGEWDRTVSALLKPDSIQIKREDIAALKRPVDVGGSNLSSVFVEQGFDVSRVDKVGRCELKLKAAFANPYNPPQPILQDWSAAIEYIDGKFYVVGKCAGGSREIQLYELKGN